MTDVAGGPSRASDRTKLRTLLDTTLRLGVVVCVAVAAAIAAIRLNDALGLYDLRADMNAAATHEQRAHTYPGWAVAGGRVMEDARLWMPEDASYRVNFGPGFDGVRSSDFTRDMLLWFLLPRRPTRSASAEWVFCYGCDDAALGNRFKVLSRADGGPSFGRMLP